MNPNLVANYLRRIASNIEKSRKPDRGLVSQDLRRILAIMLNQPADSDVNIHMCVYDNTIVDQDEMLDEIYKYCGKDSPFWFSMHNFGWICVNRNPAALKPDTPVSGAPFDIKTWGEVLANGYISDSKLKFDKFFSPEDLLLEHKDLLWWLTDGTAEGKQNLIDSLQDLGLDDIAQQAQSIII